MSTNQFLNHANKELEKAQNELYKPTEDIITYAVCKHSQHAIVDYLKAYLENKGYVTHEHETMQGLINRCKQIEPKFGSVHIDFIDCRADEINSDYCLSVDKVSKCFQVAESLDNLLKDLN